jgi:hypothetical protein
VVSVHGHFLRQLDAQSNRGRSWQFRPSVDEIVCATIFHRAIRDAVGPRQRVVVTNRVQLDLSAAYCNMR